MKNVKKTVLAVLTTGLLVAGLTGVALAGHNDPNIVMGTHRPGFAPDYYYPLVTAQSGPTKNVRTDVPRSPYWGVEGSARVAPNAQLAAQGGAVVPFAS